MSSRRIVVALAAAAVTLAACRDSASRRLLTQGHEGASATLTSPPPAASGKLVGKRLAILATDGFEQVELAKPQKLLADEGARTFVVAPKSGVIQGYNHDVMADKVTVDIRLDQADSNAFDGLVLPGGVANPDALRLDAHAVRFVRTFAEAKKPIAAICHAPWMLIEAGVVRDRSVTSWPSLKTDLLNAGAVWADREVIADHGIVTSRKPDDIEAFVKKTVEELSVPSEASGAHERLSEPQHEPGKHAELEP